MSQIRTGKFKALANRVLVNALIQFREREALRQLEVMDERMLRDIGLVCEDIEPAVDTGPTVPKPEPTLIRHRPDADQCAPAL